MAGKHSQKASPGGSLAPQVRQYLDNWRAELDAATLYRSLAAAERDSERSRIYIDLAEAEERHAALFAERLREMGQEVPAHRVSLRARLLGWSARLMGPRAVLPVINAFENRDHSAYLHQDATAASIAGEERGHARVISRLAQDTTPSDIAQRERWHRTGGGGVLRASVFGVNDGLVSNLSLVMGVAGAQPEGSIVLLAGVAGLLAGAFSMAAGEYVSMRAQRELFERQLALEEAELEVAPEEEQQELALIYRAKGIPREEAEALAARIIGDRSVALDTLAREELGLDPGELGSPWGAALGSFGAFAGGAALPVIPYLFGSGWGHLGASAALSGLALFAVGASLSLFTGRNPLLSGGRMVAIGGVAACLTYAIGTAIGISTGI
jgi:VIT1/CCC1 family predicted Fe2+/Mn2+ transporter